LGGHAIAVWRQHHPTMIDIRPWASRYTPSVGWGTAEAIGAVGATIADLDVAVAPGGNAIAVWQQDDGARVNVWANRLE
jgi:hypothetical protein